jgi:hypothetical protein
MQNLGYTRFMTETSIALDQCAHRVPGVPSLLLPEAGAYSSVVEAQSVTKLEDFSIAIEQRNN